MLILCLELIKSRLGVMSIQIRELFFIIIKTLIEKSPVGRHNVIETSLKIVQDNNNCLVFVPLLIWR